MEGLINCIFDTNMNVIVSEKKDLIDILLDIRTFYYTVLSPTC